ncbi:hypothetical protein B0H14DRAFT_2565608 [Mycena olivaceomarginata]|nr:hypothetical protein B0H14DRAFT_2565608 [Mycena olivaceomarginata]
MTSSTDISTPPHILCPLFGRTFTPTEQREWYLKSTQECYLYARRGCGVWLKLWGIECFDLRSPSIWCASATVDDGHQRALQLRSQVDDGSKRSPVGVVSRYKYSEVIQHREIDFAKRLRRRPGVRKRKTKGLLGAYKNALIGKEALWSGSPAPHSEGKNGNNGGRILHCEQMVPAALAPSEIIPTVQPVLSVKAKGLHRRGSGHSYHGARDYRQKEMVESVKERAETRNTGIRDWKCKTTERESGLYARTMDKRAAYRRGTVSSEFFQKEYHTGKKMGGGARLRGGGKERERERKREREGRSPHLAHRSITHLRTLSPGGTVTTSASIPPNGSVCGVSKMQEARMRGERTEKKKGATERSREEEWKGGYVGWRPNFQQLSYGGRDGRRRGRRGWGKKRARWSAWRWPKERKKQGLYASTSIVAHSIP